MRPAVLVSLCILAGCHSTSAIRIAIFRGEELTPLARALGYFRDEGLPVEIVEVPSSSKAMEALFGGSAEAVVGGYDQAIRLAAEGRTAQAFLVLTTRSPLSLVASPKSPQIRAIKDLKGAKVGVSAFGSSGHNMVNLLLARNGLAPGDVQIIPTGGGHAVTVAAVEHGRLEAVVTLPASLAILRGRFPGIVVLADGSTAEGTKQIFGVEQYPAVCLMAQAPWLAANGETARKLAQAMRRTLDWARGHSAEELRVKLGRAGPAEELEAFKATIASCSPDGKMPAGGPEAVRDALRISAPAVSTSDVAGTYTNRFVPDR